MISASACLIAGILTFIIGLMGLITARRFNDPREGLGFIVIMIGVCMMFAAVIVADSHSMQDAIREELLNEQLGQAGT